MIIDGGINLSTQEIINKQIHVVPFAPDANKGTVEDMAKDYDECPVKIDKVVAVPMGRICKYDILNDYMAEAVKKDSRIIAFGRVNPWRQEAAVQEMERCVKKLGLKWGFKPHPHS